MLYCLLNFLREKQQLRSKSRLWRAVAVREDSTEGWLARKRGIDRRPSRAQRVAHRLENVVGLLEAPDRNYLVVYSTSVLNWGPLLRQAHGRIDTTVIRLELQPPFSMSQVVVPSKNKITRAPKCAGHSSNHARRVFFRRQNLRSSYRKLSQFVLKLVRASARRGAIAKF
jgi:hypothetical protein